MTDEFSSQAGLASFRGAPQPAPEAYTVYPTSDPDAVDVAVNGIAQTIHREDADPEHRFTAYRLAAAYFGNLPQTPASGSEPEPEPEPEPVALGPYDRGDVLAPYVWTPRNANFREETAGSVDFDNDEGATLLTVQIVRNDPIPESGEEYTIRLAGEPAGFAIEWME